MKTSRIDRAVVGWLSRGVGGAALGLTLCGCGPSKKYEGAQAIADPKPSGVVFAETGARVVSDADLEKFSNKMIAALRKGDAEVLIEIFDEGTFFNHSLGDKLLEMNNARFADQFVKSEVANLMMDMIEGLIRSVRGSELVLLRTEKLEEANQFKLYLRHARSWYFDYFIMQVRVDERGLFYITDIEESVFVGEPLSEFCRAFYGPLFDIIDRLDPSELVSDTGRQHPDVLNFLNTLSNYSLIQQLAQQGRFTQALSTFYLLDTTYTQNFYAQKSLLSILLASAAQPVDIKRTIEGMERRWPDKFGTLNAYLGYRYQEGVFDEVEPWIVKIEERVGGDPVWDIARAHIRNRQERFAEAVNLLAGREAEFGSLKSFYFAQAGAQAGLHNYEQVADWLRSYEREFDEEVVMEILSDVDWGPRFKSSEAGMKFFSEPPLQSVPAP